MCFVCLAHVNVRDYNSILQKEAAILRKDSECNISDASVIFSMTQNRWNCSLLILQGL